MDADSETKQQSQVERKSGVNREIIIYYRLCKLHYNRRKLITQKCGAEYWELLKSYSFPKHWDTLLTIHFLNVTENSTKTTLEMIKLRMHSSVP